MVRRRILELTVLLILASISGCDRQSSYPDRPLLMICPWAVGGGTNAVSREIAMLLEGEIGQPVNVINATGGAGVKGHSRGCNARPDGYTLCMMTVELNMLHWRGLTDITPKDFEPLVLVNKDAAALFVRADAPWKNLTELTAAIRAAPGKLKASGTAKGGIWHLALAGWLTSGGLQGNDVVWIPHNGAGPSLQNLVAGGLDMVCSSLPEAEVRLDSGKIRCLGVMARERLARFADVPTFLEQGVNWTLAGWRGLGVPLGLPRDRYETLLKAVTNVVRGEVFLDFMGKSGYAASYEGPDDFATSLANADKKLGDLLTTQFVDLAPERFGPMFFPGVLTTALAFVLTLLLLRRLASGSPGDATRKKPPVPSTLALPAYLRVAGVLTAIMLVALGLEPLGFLLTAGGFLLLMLLSMGARVLPSFLITFLLVPLVYELLAHQLRFPLPRGLFGW